MAENYEVRFSTVQVNETDKTQRDFEHKTGKFAFKERAIEYYEMLKRNSIMTVGKITGKMKFIGKSFSPRYVVDGCHTIVYDVDGVYRITAEKII